MRFAGYFALAALTMLAPDGAQAATLDRVSGQVLVNRGGGFEFAQAGQQLKPGDIVVANPGARAQIVYHEGCVARVTAGEFISIGTKSPCAARPSAGFLPPAGLGH
jgi:hypothetical protein